MLLGGVAWSEIHISALPQQALSGSEVDFVGNVKTVLSETLEAPSGDSFDLTVTTTSPSAHEIKISTSDEVTLKTQLDLVLDVVS